MLLALLILGACACGHPQAVPSPTESAAPASEAEHKCVVIDAGHQRQGDPKQEPIGPSASETKPCVSDGTSGRFTGSPEYELNLAVALKLQELLEQRGYRVVMTRTDNDVNLSNRARAELAAREGGDIFVRIHANGSEDPAAHGAMTICMTPDSPFNASLYPQSHALSEAVLDCLTEATGCARERVWETTTMAGINWSTIPVTIVEMGYMTNEQEDYLLADDDYRSQIALGIADGIDRYFAGQAEQLSAAPATDEALQQLLSEFVSGRGDTWDIYAASLTSGASASALCMIYAGTYVCQRWSEELLQLLLQQTVNNRLPQGVPAGTAIAHKTGDLQNLSCGDVGIVYGPSGAYLLCIINNHSPNDRKTVSDFAALSSRVYQFFNP